MKMYKHKLNIVYERNYGGLFWAVVKNPDGRYIGWDGVGDVCDDCPAIFDSFDEAKRWADMQWRYS